jgi:hypothetical protein
MGQWLIPMINYFFFTVFIDSENKYFYEKLPFLARIQIFKEILLKVN